MFRNDIHVANHRRVWLSPDRILEIVDNFLELYMPGANTVNAPPLRNADKNLPNFNLMQATYIGL
jgi:hypothetical protein